jgi:hypothetical protein
MASHSPTQVQLPTEKRCACRPFRLNASSRESRERERHGRTIALPLIQSICLCDRKHHQAGWWGVRDSLLDVNPFMTQKHGHAEHCEFKTFIRSGLGHPPQQSGFHQAGANAPSQRHHTLALPTAMIAVSTVCWTSYRQHEPSPYWFKLPNRRGFVASYFCHPK